MDTVIGEESTRTAEQWRQRTSYLMEQEDSKKSRVEGLQLSDVSHEVGATNHSYWIAHQHVKRALKVLKIKTVREVNNERLKDAFSAIVETLFDSDKIVLLHGTSRAACDSIVRGGFNLGREGNFGGAVYTSPDVEKCLQYCGPGDEKNVLICQVRIGRVLLKPCPEPDMNLQKILDLQYDSVMANPVDMGHGFWMAEHAVFRSAQVLLIYWVTMDRRH